MSEKKVFLRIAGEDILLTKEEAEKAEKYARLFDKDGNHITEMATYFVGWENEDGDECDEQGNVY